MHSRAIFSGVFLVFGTALAVSLMPQQALSQAQVKPIYSEYKGVSIGTKADDARAKLGAPKDKSDTQDYYVFSDNESAQVLYDTDHTVRVISINYIGKLDTAPTPKAVFGSEVTTNNNQVRCLLARSRSQNHLRLGFTLSSKLRYHNSQLWSESRFLKRFIRANAVSPQHRRQF